MKRSRQITPNRFLNTRNRASYHLIISLICLVLPFLAIGQTGPGGVSTDLELWFKANAGAESDGVGTAAVNSSTVQIWQNQASDHPTFDGDQTATPGNRPTYSTDGANTINGNPVLVFDGNNHYFAVLDLNYSEASPPSAITVYSVLTTQNAAEGIVLSFDRNQYFRFATDHDNDGGFGLSTTGTDGVPDDFNASPNGIEADGAPHILGARFDPSDVTDANKFLFFDGAVNDSTNAGTSFGSTTGSVADRDRFGFLGVGSEAETFDGTQGPTNYLEGNLAEVIYFDAALTPAERQQVESYLAIKYGITLSGDTDGNGTAFESSTIDEGDYVDANGVVVWPAIANQSYHNNIVAIANDSDAALLQESSTNVDPSSVVTLEDNDLADGDYIFMGSNGATLGSTTGSASTFERELNRVWKIQTTDNTNAVDNISIDLSSAGVLPSSVSDIVLLLDDNETFDSPDEVTSGLTFVSDVVSIANLDLSSYGGNIFVTVAFNLKAPGGITTAPAFWFRADAGVEEASSDAAENGDGVAIWLDQSGNGYSAAQTDPIERPTFNSATTINFNPVLSFDGSNSELPISDLNYDLTTNTLQNLTVFSVVKSDQTDEGIILSFDRSSFFRFALNHEDNPNFGLSTNLGTDIHDNNAVGSGADGFAHLVSADFNGSTDEKNLFLDGSLDSNIPTPHVATGILGNTDVGDDEIPRFGYIGTGSEANTFNGGGSPGNILNGDLAELIFYESQLGATDRLQIESYLALKYGLTLPGNYVSSDGTTIWDATANASYLDGIAGIGLDTDSELDQQQSKSETASAVLTGTDDDLDDQEFIIWGHDGDGLDLITTTTGTRDNRIEREWKFEASVSDLAVEDIIDQIEIDISSFFPLPSGDFNDYSILQDNDADFSSIENEVVATSLVDGVLSFDNVDVGTNIYLTLAMDPDLDGDGIADADDIDEDNDGIPDSDEGSGVVDTDGDGIVDSRDLDSDNDGIGDLYESGIDSDVDVGSFVAISALDDTPEDGSIDLAETVGANGFLDILEVGNVDGGGREYVVRDDDGDIVEDRIDLDTDNNGLSDLVESGQPTTLDTDDNGLFDSGDDNDGDGISDEIDTDDNSWGSAGLAPQDLDVAINPDTPDFRDLDNDGDGTDDVVELGLTDDGGGRLDLTLQTDADADGVWTTDMRDSNDGLFGSISLASLQTGDGTDWYSYKSGDWDDWTVWTQDPSGTLRVNPDSEFPIVINENVTILNGDEVLANIDNIVLSSVTINNGAILNIDTTSNHNFNTIAGRGTIKLAADEFPGGDAANFISEDGGTVEYNINGFLATGYELSIPRTFNNMVINAPSNTIVMKSDYILNGDLDVAAGTFQINDNTGDAYIDNTTPLNFVVNGDVLVEALGLIAVGNVDASTQITTNGIFTFHQFEILGNMINNGTVDFENLDEGSTVTSGSYRDKYPTATDEDNNTGSNEITAAEFGAVEVLFTNDSEDQLITLNGHTDFYRIEINKGTSQTFIAEFNASAAANFRLLGRIAMNMSDDSQDTPNIDNNRALGLEAGILKLGNNIVVDQISKDDTNGADPFTQSGNRNYIIDLDAQLWLASNASLTKSNDWGIHPFGKLKVTDDATLNFTGTSQRAILLDNQGAYEQTGGTVTIGQFRNKTGADGAPRGSFLMSGGVMNVGEASTDGNHAVFSIPWQDQNFILKAADPANPPVINITLDGNRGKDNAAIQIGVKDGNFDVGESTINVIHTSDTDYKISSTSPFYNLVYTSTGSGRLIISDIIDADDDAPDAGGILPDDNSTTIPSPAQFKQELILLNDLIINDGVFLSGDEDVTIQNRLTIEDGGDYEPGTNTTFFSGDSPIQRIRLNAVDPVFEGFNNAVFSGSNTIKEFEGTLTTVIVQGDLTIGTGSTLNDNGRVIQVIGNLSHSGAHETDPVSPGRIELSGGSGTHEINGDGNGQFKILTLDDVNGAILLADQEVDSVLNLVTGILNADIHQLSINSTATDPIIDDNIGDGATNNLGVTRMIQTAGNPSDGGLEFFINDDGVYFYPVGVTGKYTPATADLTLTNSNTGSLQIRPVDKVLATAAQTGDNILNYYWRVTHDQFGGNDLPTVNSYNLDFDGGDVSGGTPDTEFVAGAVLDSIPHTRSYEGDVGIQVTATTILFDGLAQDDNGAGSPGPGFEVENASYTAGEISRFEGAPLIYYTRGLDRATTQPLWTSAGTWTRNDQLGFDPNNPHKSDNPASPDTPGADDVAVIGFFPFDDDETTYQGYPHGARINSGNAEAALLIFTQMTDDMGAAPVESKPMTDIGGDNDFQFRPTLTWNSTGLILIDEIRGEGTIRVRGASANDNQRDPSFAVTDLLDFARSDSSTLLYESFVAFDDFTIANIPAEVPTLQLTSDGFGANNTTVTINSDFTTNQNLVMQGNANLILGDVAGDITIEENLVFDPLSDNTGGGEVRFQNTGTGRIVNISGDILIGNGTGSAATGGSVIRVESGGTVEHEIRLSGDIIINTTGDNTEVAGNGLLFGDGTGSVIDLTVLGNSNTAVSVLSGNAPELHRLIVDKGTSPSTTFSLNTLLTLTGSNLGATKSIALENGTLILNDPDLDIDINSGGSDFTIPVTGALEIQDGTVRVTAGGTGLGNGIRLDGKLTLSGGDLIMDGSFTDPNANNYIEYGSGGFSEIEINDDASELIVGSQLRRNLLADEGVLTYTQTAGTALFGANNAPEDTRGVFEIFNTDNSSSFTLTGATSKFAIVHGQSNPALGTFILEDGSGALSVTFDNDAVIDFGFEGTAGIALDSAYANDLDESYEINTDVAIPNVRIDNDDNNSPILELTIQDLIVTNSLQILNGGTLRSNDYDLTVNAGFENDGTYEPGSNSTIFNGSSQTILGTTETVFNNLDINPIVDVTLGNNITVNNELNILTGELDDASFRIALLGDLNITTSHVSDGSTTGGISMENLTDPQEINLPDLAAEIDHLIINNTEGVTLNDLAATEVVLTIDDTLALDNGVFLIADNRVVLDESADVITSSSFSANRMLSINGVKKSDGVEKQFSASTDSPPFVIPVGTPEKYTPVTLDVDDADDPGSILIKPINSTHPSATGPDVLNYYWVVTTNPTSIAGFMGNISFQYVEEDANGAGQNEDDNMGLGWINKAARLIAPDWFKPSADLVDTVNNVMTFSNSDLSSSGGTSFDGEFTIGSEIPDELLIYRSNTAIANWNTGGDWDVDDGSGFVLSTVKPQPGSQVIIRSTDEMTMVAADDNDQNIFSVEINGTLDIGDSDGHNFGDISGNGVLRIGNPTLPGGNYDNFFTTGDGSLELAGTGSYTIAPDFTAVRGLIVSGSGTKTLPTFGLSIGADGIDITGATLDNNTADNAISVAGDITINSGAFQVGSGNINADNLTLTTGVYTGSGGTLDLSGALTIDGGTFNAGSGDINLGGDLSLNGGASYNNNSGKLIFDGSGTQAITGDFSSDVIQDIEINKPSGNVELAAGALVYVNNLLELRGGLINTLNTGARLRLLNGPGSFVRTSGYVNGPLQVNLDASTNFTFPIGKGGDYKPLILRVNSQSVDPTTWEVEYYDMSAAGYSSAENSGINMTSIQTNPETEEQVDNVNTIEFWRIDTQGGTAVAENITLDISNLPISQDNINDQELQVVFWNNANGEWDHLGGVANGTPSTGNVIADSLLSFSEKIVTTASESSDVILPVEMLYFTGEENKGLVDLDWATSTEIDNDYFEIQRSQDGRDWEVIGVVTGAGTTVEEQQYDFRDSRPYVGNSYYRLRQVDYDGRFAFTEIVLVNVRLETTNFNVYPNPVFDEFTVDIKGVNGNELASYGIVSLQGAYVGEGELRADESGRISQRLSLGLTQPAGIYILRVQTAERIFKFNLIKR